MTSFRVPLLFLVISLALVSCVLSARAAAAAAPASSSSSGAASRLASRVGRVEVLYRSETPDAVTTQPLASTPAAQDDEQTSVAPEAAAEQSDSTPPTTTTTDDAFDSYLYALNDALIDEVNAHPNATWTAARNDYFEDKSYDFLHASCGTKLDTAILLAAANPPTWVWPTPTYPVPTASLYPASFDSREKWGGMCPSLHHIRDQAGCGSCWAVAAASAMTDRHCIASEGAQKPYLSDRHMLSCCGLKQCGSCEGGYPIHAWQYWVDHGVVTGGPHGDSDSCMPYVWEPCVHYGNSTNKCKPQTATPECPNTCQDGKPLEEKYRGSKAYVVPRSEEEIMRDIMTHGPLEAGFMVYADFPAYKSGVYRHVTGKAVGGHAVKLMGWGVENGVKYWLAANSWNTDWGDNGYFKIAKGINECFIEDMIFAGSVNH